MSEQGLPSIPAVFAAVAGQDSAVAALAAATRGPVHAYLLLGPPGSGKATAASAFAAALLCDDGGCSECDTCRRVRRGLHPDVVVVDRVGPFITVVQAREIQRMAMRTPTEAARQVLILRDFHLVREAAGTLLKVVEEPPAGTVFVILASHLAPELATLASRCVRVDLSSLGADQVAAVLTSEGVEAGHAADVSQVAGGNLDRARLLASDTGYSARRKAWREVPHRLDGTGATVAVLVSELMAMLESSSRPLDSRHAEELAALEQRVERTGERGSGRKEMVERHRRESRRLRMDELRFGLASVAGVYRDALIDPTTLATPVGPGGVDAVMAISGALDALAHNPNEALLLQSLLLGLPLFGAPLGARAHSSTPTRA